MRPAVLVTGAAGVIGGAITRRLAADPEWEGCRFELSSTAPGKLGGAVRAHKLDLADEAGCGTFLREVLPGLAPFRGLVLAAGVNMDAPLALLPEDEWERNMQVNWRSAAALLGALAAPGLLAPDSAALFIGSVVGLRGNAGQAAYAASKGALAGLLRAAPPGLRLNLLLPPLVESPLLASLSPEARQRLYASRLLADPEPAASCAEAAAFLLSRRSSYVHAQIVHADSRVTVQGWPE